MGIEDGGSAREGKGGLNGDCHCLVAVRWKTGALSSGCRFDIAVKIANLHLTSGQNWRTRRATNTHEHNIGTL